MSTLLKVLIHHPLYSQSANHGLAWYRMQGDQVYTTQQHPDSVQFLPWYVLNNKGLYRTIHHPDGRSSQAVYRLVGKYFHPTIYHPHGYSHLPWFVIAE